MPLLQTDKQRAMYITVLLFPGISPPMLSYSLSVARYAPSVAEPATSGVYSAFVPAALPLVRHCPIWWLCLREGHCLLSVCVNIAYASTTSGALWYIAAPRHLFRPIFLFSKPSQKVELFLCSIELILARLLVWKHKLSVSDQHFPRVLPVDFVEPRHAFSGTV